MDRSERFWDRMAARYARTPVADEAAYQEKLRITRDYLRPDMTVLEFGCGTGSTAIAHAPYVKQIRAIDISAKMISIAQAKAEAAAVGNVSFERSDMEALNLPAAQFDAALGLSILHLLDDRDAAIAKVHALLKPGAVFISSTACLGDMSSIFRIVLPIGRALGLLPTVRIFTKTDLLNSLTRGGFEILQQWQPGKGKALFVVARKAG